MCSSFSHQKVLVVVSYKWGVHACWAQLLVVTATAAHLKSPVKGCCTSTTQTKAAITWTVGQTQSFYKPVRYIQRPHLIVCVYNGAQ